MEIRQIVLLVAGVGFSGGITENLSVASPLQEEDRFSDRLLRPT
jgi:hypothetical protein